ncbi:methionine ABC transporter substrate-binding lipoprotein MetQ [Faecalibacter rhinopitheci]|uniref:Lipoprotein n=1 Tax=Faecalibacter rhinopitheci TaxID=2779678 RepID=A0A8J7KD93_9FLAO|nr:methionine ABC transporter substrate-binding lipoprotein MetQ [Faecalibacter rhinopitheci]MBF0597061.1 methionine ABC transporter substrate-binding lipoprotein MetQ [Faecalibacter rhinopitheci]
MKKSIIKSVLAGISFLTIFACGEKKNDGTGALKVGVMSGPEYALAETAQKVAKEKYNLDVELVSFNDYIVPNEALNNGDIDANAYQTQPFIDSQSEQRGYKFAAIGNTFVYPIVGYSKKIKSLNELKDGSTIAIPNDAPNGGRSLILLNKLGLIQLKEGVGLFPKLTDIVANPKKLEIIELEAPQLTRVLDDEKVVIAVINNNFAGQAGLDATKDGIFTEDKESPYMNLVVSKEENKNDPRIKQFLQAYQSDAVEQKAKEIFKDGAIKGW